ncbi:MAG: hypothetical protein V1930_03785 [Pseudomonadota bacterium]
MGVIQKSIDEKTLQKILYRPKPSEFQYHLNENKGIHSRNQQTGTPGDISLLELRKSFAV